MYLIQRPRVILLEPVVLFRNLQDKTVTVYQQACNILPLAELNSFQERHQVIADITLTLS